MNTKVLICLVALAINIAFALFVIYSLVKINKLLVKQKKTINDVQRNQKDIKEQLNNLFKKEKLSYALNEEDKNIIIDEIYHCIRLNEEENKTTINQQQLEKEPKASKVKYPPSITKSGFPDNLSDKQNDSYFRFFEIEGDNASFDFCGNNIERAIANKVEIEQACEIVSIGSEPSKVENLEKGTVTLRDGKWEVTKKAKINFN
jgi:hypothetical protein